MDDIPVEKEIVLKETRGFTLIELMVVISIIGILSLIAIPNYINLRQKAWDASARSTGKYLQLSEEAYRVTLEYGPGVYTCDLNALLEIDKNLNEDVGVTIIFLHASASGFTIYTEHAQGTNRQYTYTD